jgi:hypothetical protein
MYSADMQEYFRLSQNSDYTRNVIASPEVDSSVIVFAKKLYPEYLRTSFFLVKLEREKRVSLTRTKAVCYLPAFLHDRAKCGNVHVREAPAPSYPTGYDVARIRIVCLDYSHTQ